MGDARRRSSARIPRCHSLKREIRAPCSSSCWQANVEAIARLHIDEWDAAERIIGWSKTKNLDRWNYMPEKGAGMAKWDKFVRELLTKKKRKTPLKDAA